MGGRGLSAAEGSQVVRDLLQRPEYPLQRDVESALEALVDHGPVDRSVRSAVVQLVSAGRPSRDSGSCSQAAGGRRRAVGRRRRGSRTFRRIGIAFLAIREASQLILMEPDYFFCAAGGRQRAKVRCHDRRHHFASARGPGVAYPNKLQRSADEIRTGPAVLA